MYLHFQNQNNVFRQAGSLLIRLGKYTASQPIRILSESVEYKQYTIFIILIIVFTFMQGIYKYTPETKHGSRVYSVAAFCSYNLWYILFHIFNVLYLWRSPQSSATGSQDILHPRTAAS